MKIEELAGQVIAGEAVSRDEVIELLELKGDERLKLFYWANQIRVRCVGPDISLCGIASIRTGRCSEDCRFCAQSGHYSTAVEYREAPAEEVIESARRARLNGAGHFGLVSSGRKLDDEQLRKIEELTREIRRIKGLDACAALGCLSESQARQLYAMGIRRYNHNLETSQRYFSAIVSTHPWEERAATIQAAKGAGMKVCCGGIIGMGESLEDRVDLATALRELKVDCAPVNFLNPIAGTPLADVKPLTALEALQTVAMFRFVLPKADIKIAGGRERCLRELQSWIFFAGASSLMIGNYLTTSGRVPETDLKMLADLELSVRVESTI
jgi:biotin synthase